MSLFYGLTVRQLKEELDHWDDNRIVVFSTFLPISDYRADLFVLKEQRGVHLDQGPLNNDEVYLVLTPFEH